MKGIIDKNVKEINGKTGKVQLDGLVYETTALELEVMSQEQQAALYAQGYRAIVATYNETVTTHALSADGSLAWIGCNQYTENQHENPDFGVAQAGYGGAHGVVIYAADRWPLFQSTLSSGERGKIVVSSDSDTGQMYHRFFPAPGPVTIGFFDADGNAEMVLADVPESLGTGPELLASSSKIQVYVNEKTIQVNYLIPQGGSQSFSRMFCYSGSYTAKTLPPWVAPDPVVELLKCLRYAWIIKTKTSTALYVASGMSDFSANTVSFPITPPVPMRGGGAPTVYISGGAQIFNQYKTPDSWSVPAYDINDNGITHFVLVANFTSEPYPVNSAPAILLLNGGSNMGFFRDL